MNKENKIKWAKPTFNAYKDVDSVIVASDGNVFLSEAKNLAQDHARLRGLTLEVCSREEVISEEVIPEEVKEKGKMLKNK